MSFRGLMEKKSQTDADATPDFTFVPYGSGSAQPSPTRATGSYPSTPAAYNAKADPFAMQAMAGQLREDATGGQETQRPVLSDARYGRSWYGGR